MNSMSRFFYILVCFAAVSAKAEPNVTIDSESEIELERQLKGEVTNLLEKLRPLQATRPSEAIVIGALRFMIRKGDDPMFEPNIGMLNTDLARETQKTLMFANPATERTVANRFVVIRDAFEVAEKLPKANFLTGDPNDRAAFFTPKYPLAWKLETGEDSAHADAFLFGTGTIAKDFRTIRLQLCAFVKGGRDVIEGTEFSVPLDPRYISAMGENHIVSSRGKSNSKPSDEAIQKSASEIRDNPELHHPLQRTDAPVSIVVEYGDELADGKVDWKVKDIAFINQPTENLNGAFLPSPKKQQRVRFTIRRNPEYDGQRLGVLLKVNGENTLLKQVLPDSQCRIWVLEPNRSDFMVDGFYVAVGPNGSKQAFSVVNDSPDQALAKRYGTNIGIISLSVFEEELNPVGSTLDPNARMALLTVKHAGVPKVAASDVFQARESMAQTLFSQNQNQNQERGVIVDDGIGVNVNVPVIGFRRATLPVMSATIRYYRPYK